MKLKRLGLTAVLFWAAGICFAPCVFASPVYTGTYVDMYLDQNTFPSGLNEQKVFLDPTAPPYPDTVTGHVGSQTGDPGTPPVYFYSATDRLNAANGYATIKSGSDDFINNITITVPGYYFNDLIFSVNLTPNANKDLTITAIDSSGVNVNESFTWPTTGTGALGNGENRILVLSTSGNLMQSVTINSVYGLESLGGLDQLKQTQISGLTPVDTTVSNVPIPAAVWLLGSGLIGLVGIRRRLSSRKR